IPVSSPAKTRCAPCSTTQPAGTTFSIRSPSRNARRCSKRSTSRSASPSPPPDPRTHRPPEGKLMSNATTLIHPSRDHLMRRHFPLSAQINAALSRITNGADAEKLLATKAPDAGGTILQAPSFVQIEFRGSLSPNRIVYPSGSTVVFAADDEQVTVDF